MSIYWLVVDDYNGPLSLVKTSGQNAVVIAGNCKGTQGFLLGKPNTFVAEPWYYESLTGKCYYPLLGEWISKLGPVEDSTLRLKILREKEAKQKIANAKRDRAKNLNTAELADINDLLSNGVSQNYIAQKYGVSKSFIRRLEGTNRQMVLGAGVNDFEAIEAPETGALRRSDITPAGVFHERL